MDRIAFFIDGGYLGKALKNRFGSPRLDYAKLAHWMAQKVDPTGTILRVYYYDCLPYRSDSVTDEESRRHIDKRSFLNKLNRLDNFEVREGKLAFRGHDENGEPIFEQKRVDVQLAVDLVSLALRHATGKIGLLTADSDFVPAIQVSKDVGVEVVLFYVAGIGNLEELLNAADRRVEITRQDIDSFRRY